MKKIIQYTLIFVALSVVMLLISFFIAGNTNIFSWENTDRFMLVAYTILLYLMILIGKEG